MLHRNNETCTDPPNHFTLFKLENVQEITFESGYTVKSSKRVCFHSDNKKDFRVVLGTNHLTKHEPAQQTLEVVETILHERYTETSEVVSNDIGDHCLRCTYLFAVFELRVK